MISDGNILIIDAVLLTIGSASGLMSSADEIDIWLTIALKVVSIISFFMVIMINYPKATESIKNYIKRK